MKVDIRKSIFAKVKSFIGVKIKKNFDILKSQVPGRLQDITSIESQESPDGFDISIKVGSYLSSRLDSGEVYSPNVLKPSLARIRVWAAHKGLSNAAVPIWLKLRSKGACKKYTNWKRELQYKTKDLLR